MRSSGRRSPRCPTRRRCWRASTRRPRTSSTLTSTSGRSLMAETTYLHAIADGLREEMRRDDRVFILGEDVGAYGGAFKVTEGFQSRFGAGRVIDTPISEAAIVG